MKPAGNKYRAAISIAFIFTVALLVAGRGLIPGKVLSSAGLLLDFPPWSSLRAQPVRIDSNMGDLLLCVHPWLIFASREIRDGCFPLWNPHSYAGAPFFANMQSALLSPFTALAYFFNIPAAIGLASILKLVIAGTSMFWFLRIAGLGAIAALAGGTTFMLSGFIIAWLGWPLASAGVWAPLLLALAEKCRISPLPRWPVLLALVTALTIFAGHPETSFFSLLGAFVYALAANRGKYLTDFRKILPVIFPFALGLLLSAVQVIPFLEYLLNGSSLGARSSGTHLSPLSLRNLMVFFSPDYFGWFGDGSRWIKTNIVEESASVGIMPWLLLPCAAAFYRGDLKWRLAILLSMVSMLVAYDFPVFPSIFSRLPVFNLVANTRMVMLIGLGLAISTAYGIQGAIDCPSHKRGKMRWYSAGTCLLILALAWAGFLRDEDAIGKGGPLAHVFYGMALNSFLAVAGTVVIMAVLSGWKHRVRAAMLIVLIQTAGLVPFARQYWPSMPADEFYPSTGGIEMLKEASMGRKSGSRVLLPLANISAVFGLDDISGYDAINPRFIEILSGSAQTKGGYGNKSDYFARGYGSPVLDICGVEYIVSPPGNKPPSARFTRKYGGPDCTVFRNTKVIPRAFLAGQAVFLPSQDDILDKMVSGFDLHNTVLLAGNPPPDPGDAKPPAEGTKKTAEIIEYRPNRVVINTQSPDSAWLVLTDTWFPGWRARIDGENTPIHRADFAFRAVRVPRGAHSVEFSYLPWSFLLGLGLSIAGLLVCAGMLLGKIPPSTGRTGRG